MNNKMNRRNFLNLVCTLPLVGLLYNKSKIDEIYKILRKIYGERLCIYINECNKTCCHIYNDFTGEIRFFDKINYQEMYDLAWLLRRNFCQIEIGTIKNKHFSTKVVLC